MSNTENKPVTFNISLQFHWLLTLFLTWSYAVQPQLLPFNIQNLEAKILLVAFIVSTFYVYRNFRATASFDKNDITALFLFVGAITVFSIPYLLEPITGDELYHAYRSTTYFYLPEKLQSLPVFQNTPINDINTHISVLFIVAASIAFYSLKLMFKNMRTNQQVIGIGVILLLIAFSSHASSISPEPHPPLRLFPLFLAQLVFGVNDMAFRLPSLMAVSFAAFLIYRLLHKNGFSFSLSLVAGLATMLIPTVFHVASISEPSVWAYLSGVACFYFLFSAIKTNDPNMLILASITIGVGTLLRQNVIIYWPGLIAIFLSRKEFRKKWFLVLFPLTFALPYFSTTFHLGHPAHGVVLFQKHNVQTIETAGTPSLAGNTSPENDAPKSSPKFLGYKIATPIQNVFNSVSSKVGPMALLRSSTPTWLFFLFAGLCFLLLKRKSLLNWFFTVLPVGYVLFFAIDSGLWGPGRYQVEYIGSATAVVITLLALALSKNGRTAFLTVLFLVGLSSLHLNITAPQDIHSPWYQKRLTTEVHRPYKDSFNFLKRQNIQGHFLFLGGNGWLQPIGLWLRGFTYMEIQNHAQISSRFETLLRSPDTGAKEIFDFLNVEKVEFILTQFGEIRDRQSQTPHTQKALELLFSEGPEKHRLQLFHSFYSPRGLGIDIWTFDLNKYTGKSNK